MAKKLDWISSRSCLRTRESGWTRAACQRMQEDAESGLELADYDNHPADAASETFERTKDHALDENFREIIERIDEALRKIEDGTYGVCDRCGNPSTSSG